MQDETQSNYTTVKPVYVTPTIVSYGTKALQAQLGPARAFSTGRSLDEELFDGDEY